jgi:hypothetical protein
VRGQFLEQKLSLPRKKERRRKTVKAGIKNRENRACAWIRDETISNGRMAS